MNIPDDDNDKLLSEVERRGAAIPDITKADDSTYDSTTSSEVRYRRLGRRWGEAPASDTTIVGI